MFCRVVAESTGAEVDQVVDILQIVVLEVGVFGVDIRQTAHLAGGAFVAVVPLGYWCEPVGMEKVVVAAYGTVEIGEHGSVVDGSVVGQHVDKHAYAIFHGAVAHGLEFVASAQQIVAHFPVGGLIIEVPFSSHRIAGLAVESFASTFANEASVGRRSLHEVISSVGDEVHVVGYGVEIPRPCVENDIGVCSA